MVHRLNAIELKGFKSFAASTRLEFPGQITAIVGPNGSGKSNLGDAFRWALGESSIAALRARRANELVFAGSEKRVRQGMASVTLSFDNRDGWFPLEFEEVAVSRRVFRDGEGEYEINGKRLRAKDVTALFAQAGLLQRDALFVGQGMLDRVLSFRPDELRGLFEQMSGTQIYQRRKDEAVGRLGETERNIQHLQSLVDELTPQWQQMGEQVKRLQAYREAREALGSALRRWYGVQQGLLGIREENQSRLVERKGAELTEAHDALGRAEEEAKSQSSGRARVAGEVNGLERDLAEARLAESALARDLAVAEERGRALEARRADLTARAERLSQEKNSLEQRLLPVREEVLGLTRQERELAERKAELERRADETRTRRDEREREMERVKAAVAALETERSRRQGQREAAEQRLKMIEEQLAEVEASEGQLREQLGQLGGRKEQIEGRFTEQTRLLQDTKSARDELLRQIASAEEKRRSVSQQEHEAARQAEQVAGELAKLQGKSRAIVDREGKSLLDVSRRKGLRWEPRQLVEYLHVADGYEPAIGAALGDVWDAFVLNGETPLASLLEELEAGKDLARPLRLATSEWATAPRRNEAPQSSGGIAATQLVDVPAEMRPLVEALLGDVLVFAEWRSAIERKDLLSQGYRLVTRDGLLFTPNGLFAANKGDGSSAFSLEKELRHAERELEEANAHRAALAESTLKQESVVETLREQEAQIEGRVRSDTAKLQTVHEELVRLQAEEESLNQRLTWSEKTREGLLGSREKVRGEEDAAETRLGEMEAQLKALAAESLKFQGDDPEASAGNLGEELAAAETAWREASKDLSFALQRVEELEQRWRTLAEEVEEAQAQAAREDAALEQVGAALAGFREARQGAAGEIERLAGQLSLKKEALSELEVSAVQRERELAEARARVDELERGMSGLQAERRGLEEERRRLGRAVQEDEDLLQPAAGDKAVDSTSLDVQDEEGLERLAQELELEVSRRRAEFRQFKAINALAEESFKDLDERYRYLVEQLADVREAEDNLRRLMTEADEAAQREFGNTFSAVDAAFKEIFAELFGGGEATLKLQPPDGKAAQQEGIEISVRLPGKRMQAVSLLSGGERGLISLALVFAFLRVLRPPFCLLDEADAMLDESNVDRFCNLLRSSSQHTQFIVITHNRRSAETADVLYGITRNADGTSQVLSLDLKRWAEQAAS
jgi:chromosome segregation protein